MKIYLFVAAVACLTSYWGHALTLEQKALLGSIKAQGYVSDAAKGHLTHLYRQCETIAAQETFRAEFLDALKRNKAIHVSLTSFFGELDKTTPKLRRLEAPQVTKPRVVARKTPAPSTPLLSAPAPKRVQASAITLPQGFKVIEGVQKGEVEQVRAAVKRGFRVERESVFWAFERKNKVLQKIILSKVPIDSPGPRGTALFMAAGTCNLGVVKDLLDNGADINLSWETSGTPLEAAAVATFGDKGQSYEQCFPVFEELIKRGATPTVRVAKLVVSARINSVATLELLLAHGLKMSTLISKKTTLATHIISKMSKDDALAFVRLLLRRGLEQEIGCWAFSLEKKGGTIWQTFLEEFRAIVFARGEKLTTLAEYKNELATLRKNLRRNFERSGDYGDYWRMESHCQKIEADFIRTFGEPLLRKYLSTMPNILTFEALMARKPIHWSTEVLELWNEKLLPGYNDKEQWMVKARIAADTKIIVAMDFGPEQLQRLKILLSSIEKLEASFHYFHPAETSFALMTVFNQGLPQNQDSIPRLIEYLVEFARLANRDDRNAILRILSPIFGSLVQQVNDQLGEEHYTINNIKHSEGNLDELLNKLGSYWGFDDSEVNAAAKAWRKHYLATALVNELNLIGEGDIPSFLAFGTKMASLKSDSWSSKSAKNVWLRRWTFVPIMKIIRPQLRTLAQGKKRQFFAANLQDQLLKFGFSLNRESYWDNDERKGYTHEAEIPAIRELFREEFDRIRNADLAELAQLQPLFDELAKQMKNLRREEFLSKGFTDKVISEILGAYIVECFHKNLATLKDQVETGNYSQLLAIQQELSEIKSLIQLLSWQNTSLPDLKLADVLGDSALWVVGRHLDEQTELNPEFFQRLKEELLPLEKLGLFSREEMARVVFARAKPAYATMLEAVAPTPITPRVGFLAGFGECPACYEEGQLLQCPAGNEDCRGLMCDKCVHRHFNEIAVVEASWAQSLCGYCHEGPIHGEFYAEALVDQAKIDDCRVVRLRRQIKGALPEWVFCRNHECPNGTWFGAEENQLFDCSACWFKGCLVCGRNHDGCAALDAKSLELVLAKGRLRPSDNPNESEHGTIRPCSECGIMTNRSAGCNHMTCKICGAHWHWNTGRNDLFPDGGVRANHDRDEMRYTPKVPPHF